MSRPRHELLRSRTRARSFAERAAAAPPARQTDLPVIAPNLWLGECDCLIGPFAQRQLAEAFSSAMVEFGHYEGICERVVVHADAFYVQAVAVVVEEAAPAATI